METIAFGIFSALVFGIIIWSMVKDKDDQPPPPKKKTPFDDR